jgi:hypothetical protein
MATPVPLKCYTGYGGRVHWSYGGTITLCGQIVNKDRYVQGNKKECQVCLVLLAKNEPYRLRRLLT